MWFTYLYVVWAFDQWHVWYSSSSKFEGEAEAIKGTLERVRVAFDATNLGVDDSDFHRGWISRLKRLSKGQ